VNDFMTSGMFGLSLALHVGGGGVVKVFAMAQTNPMKITQELGLKES
jgi:hypothetical protein